MLLQSLPSICFCSCGGAAANMEAVRGSWPCTCTAGWAWKDPMKTTGRKFITGIDHQSDRDKRWWRDASSSSFYFARTCCRAGCTTCGLGLRTPVAYLYGGMARGAGTPIEGRGAMDWPEANKREGLSVRMYCFQVPTVLVMWCEHT